MNPKNWWLIGLALIIAAGGWWYYSKNQSAAQPHGDAAISDTSDTPNTPVQTKPTATAPTTPSVSVASVNIQNFSYAPANITVKKGTKITWTNKDFLIHTVTADNTAELNLASPDLARGESYSFTFNKVGTFSYHCVPHPQMKGSVTVTE
jgi:amicyanin